MHKLINGIIEFRNNRQLLYKETFAHLALEQKPDTLFISCSDSRVVPNLFASTNPGDLFVIRNVGNIIPIYDNSLGMSSEAAAIEFALSYLPIKDIIICGHTECGAIAKIIQTQKNSTGTELFISRWLNNAKIILQEYLDSNLLFSENTSYHNKLSQINILIQMNHLKTYPIIQKRIAQAELRIHGWLFDLSLAEVCRYSQAQNKFVLIENTDSA